MRHMRHRTLLLFLPPEAENAPCRTGKHSGPKGRNNAKIEPKKVSNVSS